MPIIGLIAEYNPLHNGHIYQIKEIKKLYPDSIIILILNGYFLERGEISYMTKETKVKLALENNIDIVVELPAIYGTQASDIFAYESLKILNNFKIDILIFGSESNNIKLLTDIAIKQEDEDFNTKVKNFLDKGLNYPTSLAKSLNINNPINPNDLLGISYIKAINKINKNIKPISIKRTNSYHDIESNENIVSATNIRNKIDNNLDIKKYTPYYNFIIKPNKDIYFKLIKFAIINNPSLNTYLDVSEGIEYRLKKIIKYSNTIEELINNIKTKRYTYNRINRMLIHILLGITKNNKEEDYVRVLGFNEIGQKYLKTLNIDYNAYKNTFIYQKELESSMIYDLINNTDTYLFEIKNKPIKKSN